MNVRSGYLGISEVLAQLRADFPDVSVSKIRFLETEGLVTPARSPSGYRRFCAADVDRLRFILTAQRDQYLPLRVIKERLARLETGEAAGAAVLAQPAPGRARSRAGAGQAAQPPGAGRGGRTDRGTADRAGDVRPRAACRAAVRPGCAAGRQDREGADRLRRRGAAPAGGAGSGRARDHHDREPGGADPAAAGSGARSWPPGPRAS